MDLRWSHHYAHPMEHLPDSRILPTMHPHQSYLEPNYRGKVRSESTRACLCLSRNQHLHRSGGCYLAVTCHLEPQPSPFSEDCTFLYFRSWLFVSEELLYYPLFANNPLSPITLAIVRIKWVETWSFSTWDIIRPNLWALAEVTSALTCACIPTYKPLLLGISEVARQHKRNTNGRVPEGHGSDSEAGLRAGSIESKESCIQKPKNALLYGNQTYVSAEHDHWRV
jgi:hypothetical protein